MNKVSNFAILSGNKPTMDDCLRRYCKAGGKDKQKHKDNTQRHTQIQTQTHMPHHRLKDEFKVESS